MSILFLDSHETNFVSVIAGHFKRVLMAMVFAPRSLQCQVFKDILFRFVGIHV